jgi:hypothetical protein
VTGFCRAAFERSLWSALDPGRSPGEEDAIAAAFQGHLAAAIRADPEAAACRWHVVLLDLVRTSAPASSGSEPG